MPGFVVFEGEGLHNAAIGTVDGELFLGDHHTEAFEHRRAADRNLASIDFERALAAFRNRKVSLVPASFLVEIHTGNQHIVIDLGLSLQSALRHGDRDFTNELGLTGIFIHGIHWFGTSHFGGRGPQVDPACVNTESAQAQYEQQDGRC